MMHNSGNMNVLTEHRNQLIPGYMWLNRTMSQSGMLFPWVKSISGPQTSLKCYMYSVCEWYCLT